MNNKNDYLLPANILDMIAKWKALPAGDNEKMNIETRLIAIKEKIMIDLKLRGTSITELPKYVNTKR